MTKSFKSAFLSILEDTKDCLIKGNKEPLRTNHGVIHTDEIFTNVSQLVFPQTRKNGIRISEQELRFEFIHQMLRKHNEIWYSIETPTTKQYKGFSNNGIPECPKDGKGRSGAVDLMLFDKCGNRIALIEFKANNAGDEAYWKDFTKMNNETVPENYFVELLNTADNDTFDSIVKKLQAIDDKSKDDIHSYHMINGNEYYCIVLNSPDNLHKKPGIYHYNHDTNKIEEPK